MKQVSKPSSTTKETERKSRVILSSHKRKRDAVEGKKLNMPETLVSGVPAGRCPTVLPPCCRIHWVDLDLHLACLESLSPARVPCLLAAAGCGAVDSGPTGPIGASTLHRLRWPAHLQRVSMENQLNGELGQGKDFVNAGRGRMKPTMVQREGSC